MDIFSKISKVRLYFFFTYDRKYVCIHRIKENIFFFLFFLFSAREFAQLKDIIINVYTYNVFKGVYTKEDIASTSNKIHEVRSILTSQLTLYSLHNRTFLVCSTKKLRYGSSSFSSFSSSDRLDKRKRRTK